MLNQYILPPARSPESLRLGWLREAIKESQLFLEQDPNFKLVDENIRIISRNFPELLPGMTGFQGAAGPVKSHSAKAKIAEIIATLGNLEPLWQHVPHDKQYDRQGDILNKCTWAWWGDTQAGERLKEAIQWSCVTGTGYIFPKWNPHYHAPGLGNIELRAGGPKDFLPLWLPKNQDIQQAYAGIICEEIPITEAWNIWPTFRHQLKPDHAYASWWRWLWNAISAPVRGTESFTEPVNEIAPGQCPTVMIFYMYVRDRSRNETRNEIEMGLPHSYWSYKVPHIGQDIPTGLVNPATMQDLTRKAEMKDAYLYPSRRLVIFHQHGILYDGPSYYFHGLLPAVKMTLDPWPWSFIGGSMARDLASMEQATDRQLNSWVKRSELKHKPPTATSRSVDDTTADNMAEILDTPGRNLKDQDFATGDPVRTLLEGSDYYKIDQWELELFQMMDGLKDDAIGLNNMKALAELRQQPSGDTMEKLLQIRGSRTQAKGHTMESFCRSLGQQVFPLMLQFYDTKRRFMLFGYKGTTAQDFDYDPRTLVPDVLPGTHEGSTVNESRARRAYRWQQMFRVQIEPDSLLEITAMTKQLLILQLWKDERFPIDPQTVAEYVKLQNFGTLDDGPDVETIMGQYKKWMQIYSYGAGAMQGLQQKGLIETAPPARMMQFFQMMMQMMQMMQGGQANGNGGGGANGGGPEGRPPSFNDMPRQEIKNQGTPDERVTTTTAR